MENRKEVYFDNSATTRVFDSVRDVMVEAMTSDYGNTSSRHMKGVEAERYIREAREEIAGSLKVKEKEIVFTSGGTESNNMALIGAAMAARRKGNHLITTCIEHASVYNTMSFLEEQGFRITYLPVDQDGIVSLDALREAICDDTILVSIMYVNNEMGAVEPVAGIGKLIKSIRPDIYFHVDAIQAYGKYVIRPKKEGIDLMSVSGHKIHGPKGWAFYTWMRRSGSGPSSSAAASRRECARGQKTFRAAPVWAWLSGRFIRTMTKGWSVCTP